MSDAVEPSGGGTLQSGWPRILLEVRALARRDFVERIVVIDAEEVARLDALLAQRAEDGVVNEHAAQRADMDAAARASSSR